MSTKLSSVIEEYLRQGLSVDLESSNERVLIVPTGLATKELG